MKIIKKIINITLSLILTPIITICVILMLLRYWSINKVASKLAYINQRIKHIKYKDEWFENSP